MPRKRSVDSGNPVSPESAAPAPKPARRRKAMAAAAGVGAGSHAVGIFPADFNQSELEEVERLAYFYWQERGCQNGSPDDDWYRAEEEVRRRRAASAETNGGR